MFTLTASSSSSGGRSRGLGQLGGLHGVRHGELGGVRHGELGGVRHGELGGGGHRELSGGGHGELRWRLLPALCLNQSSRHGRLQRRTHSYYIYTCIYM